MEDSTTQWAEALHYGAAMVVQVRGRFQWHRCVEKKRNETNKVCAVLVVVSLHNTCITTQKSYLYGAFATLYSIKAFMKDLPVMRCTRSLPDGMTVSFGM